MSSTWTAPLEAILPAALQKARPEPVSSVRSQSSTEHAPDSGTAFVWRDELKYLVTRRIRPALTADLRAFASPDEKAGAGGYYDVRSLYLDSPDWKCFYEKSDGQPRRFKLRVRAYGEGATAKSVKFEIKYKNGNHIGKRVAALSAASYRTILPFLTARTASTDLPAGLQIDDSATLHEFLAMKQRYAMAPVVNVRFRRQAFVDRSRRQVRITLDDRLTARRSRELFESSAGARAVLPTEQSILEVKVHGAMPYWLQFIIRKYRLHPEPFSKYQRAVQTVPFGLETIL